MLIACDVCIWFNEFHNFAGIIEHVILLWYVWFIEGMPPPALL